MALSEMVSGRPRLPLQSAFQDKFGLSQMDNEPRRFREAL
jgi:hypothetical protein